MPADGHIPPTTQANLDVVGFSSLTMKKTAILIDGEFFSIALRHDLKLERRPSATEVYEHALRLADFET
jgi:hypothetical protein